MIHANNRPHIEIDDKIKDSLIQQAKDKALDEHQTEDIHPCGSATTLDECFTIEGVNEDVFLLWYDVEIDAGRTTSLVIYPDDAFDRLSISKL